jgi:hypothetical protein
MHLVQRTDYHLTTTNYQLPITNATNPTMPAREDITLFDCSTVLFSYYVRIRIRIVGIYAETEITVAFYPCAEDRKAVRERWRGECHSKVAKLRKVIRALNGTKNNKTKKEEI